MVSPRRLGTDRFLKMVGVSLAIHIVVVIFLNINPWPTIVKVRPTAYTVTLMPISIPEPQIPKTPAPPVPKQEKIKPVEKVKPKVKPVEKPKKDDIVEKVKKSEKKMETPTEEKKESLKHLQEALEEIRKKVALDEIQKKVALSERVEEKKPPVTLPQKNSPALEFKLEEYYNKVVESKIKQEWTIPENLLKEKELVDLEAIIIIVIEQNGKIQKWWFEKKSGNALYDQSAMRAIKKAEPLPPIPEALNKERLEFGIRFRPD